MGLRCTPQSTGPRFNPCDVDIVVAILDDCRHRWIGGHNVGIVHDKLMMLGGRLVTETVDAILADTVKSVPQEEMAVVGELRPAPKIFKDTCRIDWNQPVKRIYDFIRG